MTNRLLVVLALLLAASGSAQAPASPVPVTAVRAARMLDPRSGTIINNPVVVVRGERISAAGAGVTIPAGATIIDLGDVTLMPGLIDSHTHLLQNYKGKFDGDDPNMALTVATIGNTRRALLGAAMGREDLMSGITMVRDLGNSGWGGDVALRDAIDEGWVDGPRIVASTRALSAAGGQFGILPPEAQKLIENEYVTVSGVEEARKGVRQALYDGADVIKVIVNTDRRVVSLEEMKVIVEEAHRESIPVAAHAIGIQATNIAVSAGVNSIEHAYTIADSTLATMAAKGIFLVPTDYPAEAYLALGAAPATPAERAQRLLGATGFANGNKNRLQRAIKAGVKIAFGSDEYYDVPGSTRGQSSLLTLHAYTYAGMSPLEVIRAATINSAELLQRTRQVGTLEAGKFADIIAVPGNPLEDILALDHVRFVMKGGKVYRNDVAGH